MRLQFNFVRSIVIKILQSIKKVKLESIANALPLPMIFESRRKKLQRFLSLPGRGAKAIRPYRLVKFGGRLLPNG